MAENSSEPETWPNQLTQYAFPSKPSWNSEATVSSLMASKMIRMSVFMAPLKRAACLLLKTTSSRRQLLSSSISFAKDSGPALAYASEKRTVPTGWDAYGWFVSALSKAPLRTPAQ